ncbi:MAG: immunoglobulin domain-containing protein [Verrucomicrobia bacterium]|nr:immunoglobulin domain-containing protein [Verrucomicrobiota bacterium]
MPAPTTESNRSFYKFISHLALWCTLLMGGAGSLPAQPAIVQQPRRLAITLGQPATFSVTTGNAVRPSFQWRKNGVPVTGASLGTLHIPATVPADAGSYDVVVADATGSATSSAAALVLAEPPTINLDQWRWRNPAPQGNTLSGGVIWTGTRFLTAGWGGTILTSDDGTTWANVSFPSKTFFWGVASGGGRMVAVGEKGVIVTSTDAAAWTPQNSGTTVDLHAVVWAGTMFVACGSGAFLTSPDGVSWTQRTGPYNGASAMAWNGSLLVATVNSGLRAELATSPDAITWTTRPITTSFSSAHLNAVTWTGTQFVAVGAPGLIVTSRDGVTWNSAVTDTYLELFAVGGSGSRLVAAGEGRKILSTEDGAKWTSRELDIPDLSPGGNFHGVAWNGRQFVVVGEAGMIFTSADGVEWLWRSTRIPLGLGAVTSNGSRTVAVGSSATYLTTDGVSWSTPAPVIWGPGAGTSGIAWMGDRFVRMAGWFIGTSQDGAAWSYLDNKLRREMNAVIWNGAQCVAVGESGTILTSPDSETWTERRAGSLGMLYAVAWSGKRFVVVGYGNSTSTDGIAWTAVDSLYGGFSVVWSGTQFVIVGAEGAIVTSPDGLVWTRRVSGTTQPLNGVTWDGRRFVAVGGYGTILSSADGITWTSHRSGTVTSLKAIHWTGAYYVVLGDNGIVLTAHAQPEFAPKILTQPEAQTVPQGASARFSVTATGDPAPTYQWRKNGVEIPGATMDALFLPSVSAGAAATYSVRVANARGSQLSVDAALAVDAETTAELQQWTWRNPLPHGDSLTAIASDGSQFVAVGNNGLTKTTADGVGWSVHQADGQGNSLLAIARGAGRFVAVGYNETIVSSANGIEWTRHGVGGFNTLQSVAWSGSQFLAVGERGTVFTSPDGIAWTKRTVGASVGLISVAWGGSQFVATAMSQGSFTSPDGVTWTRRTSATLLGVRSVASNGSLFVAVGDTGRIVTSPDGIAWTVTSFNSTDSLASVVWNGAVFVAVGSNGTLFTSPNGSEWTPRSTGMKNGLTAVAWNGKQWLAVGEQGAVLTSTDGAVWTNRTSGLTSPLRAVASNRNVTVAVGAGGTVMTSPDGVAWVSRNAGTTKTLNSVAWIAGQFFAMGAGGTFRTSADGTTWTVRDSPSTAGFNAICWNGSMYVMVGEGGIIQVSYDTVVWSNIPIDPSARYDLTGVTWDGKQFVAVGTGATILTSPDGIRWQGRRTTGNDSLAAIVWNGTKLVAVGTSGAVHTSADGANWVRSDAGVTDFFQAVSWNGGQFVAVGGAGAILASADGVTWRRLELATGNRLSGVTWDGGQFVAVGENGTILTSGGATEPAAPVVTRQPVAQSTMAGGNVALTVSVSGVPKPALQWFKNGVPVTGATAATLSLAGVRPTDSGHYSVVATNARGATTSNPVALAVTPPAGAAAARLINVSILAPLASPDDSITLGTVVGGHGTLGVKPVLVRAAGPSLRSLGVADPLADPQLEFYLGSTKTVENDNWGGGSALAGAFVAVGAFPFEQVASLDAAIFAPALAPGGYSARVAGHGGTGPVLLELYESTPGGAFTPVTPRFINASVLKQVGPGFTVGFVIGGGAWRQILVRAIGPGLAAVGVTGGFLTDPQLALHAGGTTVGLNDDWGGLTSLAAASTAVGAFQVPANSRDAVLMGTLEPGNYTVRVAGPPGQTGLVLVEVYEMP